MKREQIAAVCHAVNAAFCASMGDNSQLPWADAPEWQKASALAGVDMHLANPDATPEQSHESWLAVKVADGWAYGEVKDVDKKLHPCVRPYAELPAEQRAKDYLFKGVVAALKDIPDAIVTTVTVTEDAAVAAGTHIPVRYIGPRPVYKDGIYQTGLVFQKGQSRPVPADKAKLMLAHKDVYELGDTRDLAPTVADPAAERLAQIKKDDNDPINTAVDALAGMTKAALTAYTKNHFRQDLDQSMKVADMRAHVTNLIHQFGLE